VSARSSSGWQQPLGGAAGLAGCGHRGLVVAGAEQALGVVEQAVREGVGGGVLGSPAMHVQAR